MVACFEEQIGFCGACDKKLVNVGKMFAHVCAEKSCFNVIKISQTILKAKIEKGTPIISFSIFVLIRDYCTPLNLDEFRNATTLLFLALDF